MSQNIGVEELSNRGNRKKGGSKFLMGGSDPLGNYVFFHNFDNIFESLVGLSNRCISCSCILVLY